MAIRSLVVVMFGENRIALRRHWGGAPEVELVRLLHHLREAQIEKPRRHFHTGSWLIRRLVTDGDFGGTSLPNYEILGTPDGVVEDWETAYFLRAKREEDYLEVMDQGALDRWEVGYFSRCRGEPIDELLKCVIWQPMTGFSYKADSRDRLPEWVGPQ